MDTTIDQVEPRARTPKAALALLAIVGLLLLFQLGVVITRAWADMGGGSASTAIVPDLTSDRVAATAAEFRVDESGAATYSVPLYVVPGTAGVAPQLSLSYSSQGGYGPMGMGWSIGGLSSVTRCRATRENGDFIVGGVPTDGTPQPVNFTASDRYCLDGQRLIPSQAGTAACPAISGMAVVNLRTEIESFQRVCAYTPTGGTNGPAFFTVDRKDGSRSWYGDRAADTTDLVDGYFNVTTPGQESAALTWAQTRFQDSTGNYIDYVYAEKPAGGSVGEQVISEVRYTGKKVLAGQSGSASAPYAKVVFNYSALPTAQWEYRYASGGQYVQSRRLESVTVCATIACETANQARHYVLTYGTTVSNSGRQILTSLKECRDNTAAVCMLPTTFEWSQAKNELGFYQNWQPGYFGSASKFGGFKLGDVDGDGRLDMVWLKEGSSGDTCSTEHIMVSFGELDASNRQSFAAGILAGCTPTELAPELGEGSWQLFDYTGDGRDDLFVGGASYWNLYASQGRTGTVFVMSSNLLSSILVPRTATYNAGMHPQTTDLNGDGLLDVVYQNSGLKVRVMERSGGTFTWGAERTATFTSYPPPECPPDSYNCRESTPALWNPDIFRLVDFNGDAASDLIFEIAFSGRFLDPCDSMAFRNSESMNSAEQQDPNPRTATEPVYDDGKSEKSKEAAPMAPPCPTFWTSYSRYAYGISSMTATTVEFKRLMPNELPWMGITPSGLSPQLADFNGDGLTDLFIPGKDDSSQPSYYALNTGTGFTSTVSLGIISNAKYSKVVDLNGDGRSDIAFPDGTTYDRRFKARYGQADGSLSATTAIYGSGSGAVGCLGTNCDPAGWVHLFADLDGDAGVDFFALEISDNTRFLLAQPGAMSRMQPRDTVAAVVNGFGARTELTYASLTNNAAYRRDTGSRDGTNWGRGSPVQDFLAPMYVVIKASSSAPQDGNPGAMASLYYRYAGAKIQAGGRGFLGFREIVTYGPNEVGGHVQTVTHYNQNFPFIGMPARTMKWALTDRSHTPSSCITGTVSNTCYSTPGQGFPAQDGSLFGDSRQTWEADTDNTAGAAAFASGVQAPIHVRTLGTDELTRDPYSGAIPSRVATAFGYGSYGNVSSTVVDTYTGDTTLSNTVITNNTYTDDATKWRLSRLTATTVTHRRPGKTDVVKTASFAYDMAGAVTGQMTQERTQPGGGVNQELLKAYTLDAYGNRTRVSTCSIDIAGCGSAAVAFNPNVATSINRYSRVVYDGQGRYPVATYEPFWNGSGASEQVTQTVVNRNLFGDVTQAYNVNGADSIAVAGTFGRPYYAWAETVAGSVPGAPAGGIDSTTLFRMCGPTTCPTGGKFLNRVSTDGQPSQWTYYDVLGRPILKVAETFNTGVANKDLVAVCTTYDGTGKPKRASNPFFLSGATTANLHVAALSGVCTDPARTWTTTTYDLLGRPTRVDSPDSTYSTLAYSGNQTTATDPRGNATTQVRNGAGELVSVTDAAGLALSYDYAADGSQTAVNRDAGRGAIQNLFQYDERGRKIYQNDPDSGITWFGYNALGELIAQQDGADNRIEFLLDARGRVRQKLVKRADTNIESQSVFVFDTQPNGLGQPVSEMVTGTYDNGEPGGQQLNFSRGYGYDSLGRGTTVSTTIDNGPTYTQTAVLDGLGRAYRLQDASGKWQTTEFTSRGYAAAICSGATSVCGSASTWQRTQETDQFGNVIREIRAGDTQIPVTRSYNPLNGRQAGLCAGLGNCNLVNEQYAWDAAGNLSTQTKENRYAETFYYDNLNRLTHGYLTMVDGVTTNTLTHWAEYDKLGNICARLFQGQGSGTGYAGRAGCGLGINGTGTAALVGAHRLTTVYTAGGNWNYSWDARGNQTVRDAPGTANDRTIKYSLDDHAYEISTGNGKRTRYWYGPDGQRYKREDIDGTKTLYLGQVEVVIQGAITKYRRTIGGLLVQTVQGAVIEDRYLFTDRLGSVVKYTDGSGALVQSLDYDDWGQRRDYNEPTQTGVAAPTPTIGLRGFTGHEMVDGQDVVNMNARMYDPMLGRFLQADPMIQAPENAQSWNAYTYVFNNPLTLVDPTGMFSWQKALSVFGQILNIASYFFPILKPFAIAFNIVMGMANGGVKGGLLAAFGSQIPGFDHLVTNIAVGALYGGVSAVVMGGKFKEGAVGALKSAAIGMVMGAIAQGVRSRQTGGKNASGADSEAAMGAVNSDGGESTYRGLMVGKEGYDTFSERADWYARMQVTLDAAGVDTVWFGVASDLNVYFANNELLLGSSKTFMNDLGVSLFEKNLKTYNELINGEISLKGAALDNFLVNREQRYVQSFIRGRYPNGVPASIRAPVNIAFSPFGRLGPSAPAIMSAGVRYVELATKQTFNFWDTYHRIELGEAMMSQRRHAK